MNLQFKTYIMNAGNASVINNNIEKIAFRAIYLSFLALGVLYILLLANMVTNILERRSFETKARTLSTEVSNLELTYLSMSNNVDLALSHSMGFKETKATFTTRKSLGLRFDASHLGVNAAQNDL